MEIDISKMDVVHNVEKKQFEMQLGEQLAKVQYILGSSEIIFTHTEVPEAFEGQGIAGKIAKVALDYAKDSGMRVRPMCPYIAAYIKRHPEYQSITAGY